MEKLTKISIPSYHPGKLTDRVDTSFTLGFRYPLESGYTFKEMNNANIKHFQKFLNKISKMTVQQVDTSFALNSDKNDEYNGIPVNHYKVTDAFRIHTIFEDGVHIIIRIDPNHHFHS